MRAWQLHLCCVPILFGRYLIEDRPQSATSYLNYVMRIGRPLCTMYGVPGTIMKIYQVRSCSKYSIDFVLCTLSDAKITNKCCANTSFSHKKSIRNMKFHWRLVFLPFRRRANVVTATKPQAAHNTSTNTLWSVHLCHSRFISFSMQTCCDQIKETQSGIHTRTHVLRLTPLTRHCARLSSLPVLFSFSKLTHYY